MDIRIPYLVDVGLAASALSLCACVSRPFQRKAPVCAAYSIDKAPLSRVEMNSVLVYTYGFEGAGCPDYTLIIVPSEQTKSLVLGLLRGLGVIKDSDAAEVSTLAQEEETSVRSGESTGPGSRLALLTDDLHHHAAVVQLYVNKSAPPR